MKLYILLLLVVFTVSCSNQGAGGNSNLNTAKKSPSPTPTPTKEEVEKKEKTVTESKQNAIKNFIDQNFKGWALQGIGNKYGSPECEEELPCQLHLTNKNQNKVITVILQSFYKSDGTSYWLVREARQIDLAQIKIEEIKERERESVLENLTADDVKDSVRDEIIENHAEEARDDLQDNEPYDPRG